MHSPTIAQALAFIDAITKSSGSVHFDAVLGKGATITSKDIESTDPDSLDRVEIFLEHIEDCARVIRLHIKGRPRQTKLVITDDKDGGVELTVKGAGEKTDVAKDLKSASESIKKRLQGKGSAKATPKKAPKKGAPKATKKAAKKAAIVK